MHRWQLRHFSRRTLERTTADWEGLSDFAAYTLSVPSANGPCRETAAGFLTQTRLLVLTSEFCDHGFWVRVLREYAASFHKKTEDTSIVETGRWDVTVAPVDKSRDERFPAADDYPQRYLGSEKLFRWADVVHMDEELQRADAGKLSVDPGGQCVFPVTMYWHEQDNRLWEGVESTVFGRSIANTVARTVWSGYPFFLDVRAKNKRKEQRELVDFILGERAGGDTSHYDQVIESFRRLLPHFVKCDSDSLWDAFANPTSRIRTNMPAVHVVPVDAVIALRQVSVLPPRAN